MHVQQMLEIEQQQPTLPAFYTEAQRAEDRATCAEYFTAWVADMKNPRTSITREQFEAAADRLAST